MITGWAEDGAAGRLIVEKTWAEIVLGGEVAGWYLTQLAATLDGEPVFWPRSKDLADDYAAAAPDFREWLDRTEP